MNRYGMPITNYTPLDQVDRSTVLKRDDNLLEPQATSLPRPIYPWEGDTQSYLMEQDFMCYIDTYPRYAPTPGTQNPIRPEFYFLEDTPIRDTGVAGVGTFTRTWGMFPGWNGQKVGTGSLFVRKEPMSYVWTKPGYSTNDQFLDQYFIDNDASLATDDGTYITLYTTVNSITAQRFTVDLDGSATATIFYVVNKSNWISGEIHEYTTNIVETGTNYIKVKKVPYDDSGESYPIVYGYFQKPAINIEPKQRVVSSIVYYDYWIPGINIDSIENVPLVQEFRVLDENENESDILTEASTPTQTQYAAMVANKTMICMEASQIRRWRGNIFERTTRYGYPV